MLAVAFLLFHLLPAAFTAGFSAVAAAVYLRSGPAKGLSFLALLGLAAVLLSEDGEWSVSIVLLAFLLVGAVRRNWSLSRTVWLCFAGIGGLTFCLWIFRFATLSEGDALLNLGTYLEELAENVRTAPANLGLSEIDAARAAISLLAAGPWVTAAFPGVTLASQFLVVWWGLLFLYLLQRSLPEHGEELLRWSLPWPLVWVLLFSAAGILAFLEHWPVPLPQRALQILSASGLSLAASWFLVQGFLVGLVALARWRFPRWLGVPGLFIFWWLLPLLGLLETWVDLRGRLRRPPEEGAAG